MKDRRLLVAPQQDTSCPLRTNHGFLLRIAESGMFHGFKICAGKNRQRIAGLHRPDTFSDRFELRVLSDIIFRAMQQGCSQETETGFQQDLPHHIILQRIMKLMIFQ